MENITVKVELLEGGKKSEYSNNRDLLVILNHDVEKFSSHFSRVVKNSRLTGMEKEILKAYLYYKVVTEKE